ncbi:MAG: hypothetical protein JWR21_219 [Herminiimonas sp.]|nr:hypothetical protein [Herminiimonas sp.]
MAISAVRIASINIKIATCGLGFRTAVICYRLAESCCWRDRRAAGMYRAFVPARYTGPSLSKLQYQQPNGRAETHRKFPWSLNRTSCGDEVLCVKNCNVRGRFRYIRKRIASGGRAQWAAGFDWRKRSPQAGGRTYATFNFGSTENTQCEWPSAAHCVSRLVVMVLRPLLAPTQSMAPENQPENM